MSAKVNFKIRYLTFEQIQRAADIPGSRGYGRGILVPDIVTSRSLDYCLSLYHERRENHWKGKLTNSEKIVLQCTLRIIFSSFFIRQYVAALHSTPLVVKSLHQNIRQGTK